MKIYRFKFVCKDGTSKFLHVDDSVSLAGLLHSARSYFVVDKENALDFIDVYEGDKKIATFYK